MKHGFFNIISSKGKSACSILKPSDTKLQVWNLLPKGPYKKCSEKQHKMNWTSSTTCSVFMATPSCFATSTGAPAPASTGTRVRLVQLEFSCLCWEAARLMSAKCLPPVISQWSFAFVTTVF